MAKHTDASILMSGVAAYRAWLAEDRSDPAHRDHGRSNFLNVAREDLRGVELPRCSFRGEFSGANFTAAKLYECIFRDSYIMNAYFNKSYLQKTKFLDSNLTESVFANADAAGMRIEKCTAKNACFDEARMVSAYLGSTDFENSAFHGTDLTRATLRGSFLLCDLSNAKLGDSDLSGSVFLSSNMSGANLRGARLSNCDLRSVDFRGADLTGADLSGADLRGAQFGDANLENANLRGVNLVGVSLADANGNGPNVRGADFRSAAINMLKVFEGDPRKYGSPWRHNNQRAADSSGILELASCINLDEAIFDSEEVLPQYLENALRYLMSEHIPEAEAWPKFVERVTQNLRAMRSLFAADTTPPDALIDVVSNINAAIIEYLKQHPQAIHDIDPRQFEELVAEMLAGFGWKIDLTPKSKDGGYDIFAVRRDIAGIESAWVIECKKYAPDRKVGVEIVRALFGTSAVLHHRANTMIATTSAFTRGAREMKASMYNLELKEYGDILEWINHYKPNPDGKLYIRDNRLIMPDDAKRQTAPKPKLIFPR